MSAMPARNSEATLLLVWSLDTKLDPSRDEETAAWVATAAARQPSGRRQEKENMAAFLAKKREIFLVQARAPLQAALTETCMRSVGCLGVVIR